jgi:gluconolactonase
MTTQIEPAEPDFSSRRGFLGAALGGAIIAAAAGVARSATQAAPLPIPPPVPRDWSHPESMRYPDADIVALDERFRPYIVGNTTIKRLHTGTSWAEGPAWNGVGRFLVWSDIPNNVQLRWIEDDARVSVFRSPSGYSNGNTFDYQGRQISCEHGGRRVVRYEQSGAVSVIAAQYQGKRLNSPNDVVVHPDGGIWFTDPSFGIRGFYEGFKAESELPMAVYRVDGANGRIEKVTDALGAPNGLCFSPDYRKLYIADSAKGRELRVFDVDNNKLRNERLFVKLTVPGSGAPSAADGMRCDTDGNLWAGAAPGVQVVAPDGQPIGMIRLPEGCANLCFGGEKRNRLFMVASQSLFAVHVNTQGAHIA